MVKTIIYLISFSLLNIISACHTGSGDPVEFEVATKDTYFNYYPTKLEQLLDHESTTKFDGVVSLIHANLFLTETDENEKITSEAFGDILIGEADFYESQDKFITYFQENNKEGCVQYFEEKNYLGRKDNKIPDDVKIPKKVLIGHLAFSTKEKSSDKEEKTIFNIPIVQMKDDAGSIDIKNILQTKVKTPILFNKVYSIANWDKDYAPYLGIDGNSIIDKFKNTDAFTFPPKLVLTLPDYLKVTEKKPLIIKKGSPVKFKWENTPDFSQDKLKPLQLLIDLKSKDEEKIFKSVTECYLKDDGEFDLEQKYLEEIIKNKATGAGNLSLTRYSEQTVSNLPNGGKLLIKIKIRQQIPVIIE